MAVLRSNLTDEERSLIRDHVDRLIELEIDLPALVYTRFFEGRPEIQDLFGPSLANKRQMLDDTLVAVVDLVDGASWLLENLLALGSRHRHTYEATEAMYGLWEDAVIQGFHAALGEGFTPAHEAAYRKALGEVHHYMLVGAYPKRFAANG